MISLFDYNLFKFFRRTLEECSRKVDVARCVFPFNFLRFRVSHHCFELLHDELERMGALSDEVYQRCGCVLRRTCGIPCACELARAKDSKLPITLDRIHEFWKTFKFDDTGYLAQGADPNDPPEELRYFEELVDKVRTADRAVVRNISLLMNDHLHPEHASYGEPETKGNPRGRPRGGSSTRRDLSGWEHMERGRGRGRTRGRGRGRSSSRGSCSSNKRSWSESSTHNLHAEDGTVDIDVYENKHRIPGVILPYTRGVVDVKSDGNCGFRTLAHYMFQDEDGYRTVRDMIWNEIAANRDLYSPIYADVDAALERIRWNGGRCGQEHWMHTDDLYPFATLWRAAIMVFAYGDGNNWGQQCSTVLPLRAPPRSDGPEREIVIAHLGTRFQHFICLSMLPNFPAPHINGWWNLYHTPSVNGWDGLFSARIGVWASILDASES